MSVRPADIIRKYYKDNPGAHQILLDHSRLVTRKAVQIAKRLQQSHQVDIQFIAEAAMLHDIGMIATDASELACYGQGSYLLHGIAGRKILEAEGLPKHALVCERHIGVGLSAAEIEAQQLPLPRRDMLPRTLEEQIICYADLFFSKSKKHHNREKSPSRIRASLRKYGEDKLPVFENWRQLFEPELN